MKPIYLEKAIVAFMILLGLAFIAGRASAEQPQPKDKYRGSASATCECADGKCVQVSCEVSGQASYEAAKRALRSQIQTKIQYKNGKLKGSISFSISVEFAEQVSTTSGSVVADEDGPRAYRDYTPKSAREPRQHFDRWWVVNNTNRPIRLYIFLSGKGIKPGTTEWYTLPAGGTTRTFFYELSQPVIFQAKWQ